MESLYSAADLHNLGNKNVSLFYEPPKEDISAGAHVSNFLRASIYSASNELYNTAQGIKSWFGADTEARDLETYLKDVDTNLVEYYTDHKDAIDVVGFTASSMLPGLGSVKLLRASQLALKAGVQSGKIGGTLAKATGLLVPKTDDYLRKAIADITASDAPFTAMRSSVLKSLGSGFHQNFLESVAFETAVAATMYKSPVFTHMDATDMLWNGFIFAGLGGVIGGTLQGVQTAGKIKAGVRDFKSKLAPYETIVEPAAATSPSERFALYILDRDRVPAVPNLTGDPVQDALIQRQKQAAETTGKQREVKMRAAASDMAGGDEAVAQVLWENIKNSSSEDALALLLQMKQIGRVSKKTSIDREIAKLEKKLLDPLEDLESLARQREILGVKYLHAIGPTAGKISEDTPQFLRLVDTITKRGERVHVDAKTGTVTAGKNVFKFSGKTDFNILKASPLEAEARRLYLEKIGAPTPGSIIPEADLPQLDAAYKAGVSQINVKLADGSLLNIASPDMFLDFIKQNKLKYSVELQAARKDLSHGEIAHALDVHPDVLGTMFREDSKDFFATSLYAENYTKQLVKSGVRNEASGILDITNVPTAVKATYDLTPLKGVDGNVLHGEMILKHKQRLYQEAADQTAAAFLPRGIFETLPEISNKDIYDVDIFAPGRGFAGASNSPYSTLGNTVEYIGQRTVKAMGLAEESFKETFNPLLHAVIQKPQAAIEFSVLNQTVRAIPEQYILDPDGGSKLVLKKLKDYEDKVEEALEAGKDPAKVKLPVLEADIPKEIPIQNEETYNLVEAFILRDSQRVNAHASIKSLEGVTESRLAGVFYPMTPSPKDYKYFAFVVDKSVQGVGRSKMIYAQSAEHLDQLIASVNRNKPAHWEVLTKKDAENWYKAIGQFEYEKTLKDVNFDYELKRMGASSPIIVPTDPSKITADFLDWNILREKSLVRELILHKYQPQFDTLRTLGSKYTNIATSKKGSLSLLKYAEDTVANPYADYIKTALGIPRTEEYAWWFGPQKAIDNTVSKMYETVQDMFYTEKSAAQLEEINKTLESYGFKGPNYDGALERWANHTAPRGALTTFARKANALLATATLRLDFLNSANNIIGSNILYYGELQSVIKALKNGDAVTVGKLANLEIAVPGTTDKILSPTKLHGEAIKNYFAALRIPDSPVIQKYKDLGFITSITDQYRHVIDELTLTGKESIREMETKLGRARVFADKFVERGEKITGNKFAEEYNRFVAADSARQVFQLAVDAGQITEAQMWANVSTFVRRTQGTYDAFLRPAVFQGPVGQMIGLFQTYQFNLMQQLLRHVAEGDAKDAMMMMALQGSIYGLNGLPAFNAINTHIVGTASGNPENKDFYSTVYSGAGKDLGDWLLYGAASNILGVVHPDLRVNMYSRGDINPRHLTVVPASIEDIPIVNATAKIFGGMKAATQNIANGGDVWNSFLQGVQHASVNRPLAGLAQIAQFTDNPTSRVYGTTAKGYVISSNELLSLANLGRLAGGKPFDQAIMQDFGWRSQVYQTKNSERKNNLGRAIRTTLLSGKQPSPGDVEGFAQSWVDLGMPQEDFNQFFMKQMVESQKEYAERLADTLRSPTLQRLQGEMGGVDPYSQE